MTLLAFFLPRGHNIRDILGLTEQEKLIHIAIMEKYIEMQGV